MNHSNNITNFIDLSDLLITPFFLIILYFFVFAFFKRISPDPLIRKYFVYGLTVKIFGALMFGLIYQFYYSGAGDTALFYALGSEINHVMLNDPIEGLKLIFYPESIDNMYRLSHLLARYQYDPSTFLIGRISGVFSLFCFNTYTSISILFAVTTFYGIWKLFKMLIIILPQLHKQLAFAFLFYPSIIFWGSGIMKDGVALSSLCFGFYCLFNLFHNKYGKTKYVIGLAFALYLMSYIKIYITLCFIPTGFLWIFTTYNHSIKSSLLRWISWPIVLVLGLGLGIYSAALISENDTKYRLDKLAETAQETSTYLTRISTTQEGSAYSLGEYEPTLSGMLPKLPEAIWVTLFRPYVWEIRNPLMLLSALESFSLFVFTFLVFFRTGLKNAFSIIFNSPFLIFCMVFTLVFASAVGISTYNFGTLVRYKIPMLPFYVTLLFYIRNYTRLNSTVRF